MLMPSALLRVPLGGVHITKYPSTDFRCMSWALCLWVVKEIHVVNVKLLNNMLRLLQFAFACSYMDMILKCLLFFGPVESNIIFKPLCFIKVLYTAPFCCFVSWAYILLADKVIRNEEEYANSVWMERLCISEEIYEKNCVVQMKWEKSYGDSGPVREYSAPRFVPGADGAAVWNLGASKLPLHKI